MSHLHSLGAMHRDLKPANILLHFPKMHGQEHLINDTWLNEIGSQNLADD